MFKASTPKLQALAAKRPDVIEQLERLLIGRVNVYIDYANVRPWSRRLRWHIDLKRLHQFLRCFDTIQAIRFYYGLLQGDPQSERLHHEVTALKYTVRTKPVKIMKISIDASSISPESPDLLKQFIVAPLLRQLDIGTIEYLNSKLVELNGKGIKFLEDRKCNFDVEIGRDMILDQERGRADSFVLWSTDSDFHEPIKELLDAKKRVILVATAGLIASELNALRAAGLVVFDIKKLRDFICWNRELGG
jgi:uncharacterized LabA/DUF88 family protein